MFADGTNVGSMKLGFRKFHTFAKIIVQTLAWLFLSSISKLVPKDKNLVVILAPTDGSFSDNAKYAYLWLEEEKSFKLIYVTWANNIKVMLDKNAINAECFPSFSSVKSMLRANVVIGTHIATFQYLRGHLVSGGKLVQLWHGAGIKKRLLEIDKELNKISKKRKILGAINRSDPLFNLFYFPSHALFEERKSWYRFIEAKINGNLRNDLLLGKSFQGREYIHTDFIARNKIESLKAEGFQYVLYAPTFRQENKSIFNTVVPFDFRAMNQLMDLNKGILVLKCHPRMMENIEIKGLKNIFIYDKNKDIYPFLGQFDLLITDYSSIFSDFALLNKPVIHYIPDLADVIRSRKITEGIIDHLPGKLIQNFSDLMVCLEDLLKHSSSQYCGDMKTFYEQTEGFSGPKFINDIIRLH